LGLTGAAGDEPPSILPLRPSHFRSTQKSRNLG